MFVFFFVRLSAQMNTRCDHFASNSVPTIRWPLYLYIRLWYYISLFPFIRIGYRMSLYSNKIYMYIQKKTKIENDSVSNLSISNAFPLRTLSSRSLAFGYWQKLCDYYSNEKKKKQTNKRRRTKVKVLKRIDKKKFEK